AATAREPWFVRPAGPIPAGAVPPELEVVRVSTPAEVAEFERVSVRGFGGDDAAVETGSLHPASLLDDPRMTMLTGRGGGPALAVGDGLADPPRDNHAMHLVGAVVDVCAAGDLIHVAQRRPVRQSEGAVHLEGAVDHVGQHLRRVEFDQRDLDARLVAGVDL